MRKKIILLLIVTMFSLVFLIQNAFGAVYMKQKQHSDAVKIMGTEQPARDMIVESWITTNKMVTMNNKQKTVIDLDKKTITTANHEEKTIPNLHHGRNRRAFGRSQHLSIQQSAQNYRRKITNRYDHPQQADDGICRHPFGYHHGKEGHIQNRFRQSGKDAGMKAGRFDKLPAHFAG